MRLLASLLYCFDSSCVTIPGHLLSINVSCCLRSCKRQEESHNHCHVLLLRCYLCMRWLVEVIWSRLSFGYSKVTSESLLHFILMIFVVRWSKTCTFSVVKNSPSLEYWANEVRRLQGLESWSVLVHSFLSHRVYPAGPQACSGFIVAWYVGANGASCCIHNDLLL